ncbi:antitoxin VapB family protein [Haloterrigena salinisoli]|uniref:antitoxin VapB family protein n=1 Tax=Haloterrigena salinisoli TaxID=3132747 RepID=UPI0030CE7EC7
MGSGDEQVRVSDRVKRELGRRTRATESYNNVLERISEDTGDDFADGFGILSGEQADRLGGQRN